MNEETTNNTSTMSLDFIGSIADAAASMSQSLNPDYLNAQVAIADANARAAEANATTSKGATSKKTLIYLGVGVVAVVALILIFKK